MLNQMRSAAKSWVAKLFLGLLGVSFLVWGVPSSFLPQIGGGNLFSSGSSSVRPNDYAYLLRDTLLRRGVDRLPSASELRASGLTAEILLRLQLGVLLDEEVRLMQLGADDDAALQILRRDPIFHNMNGDFDRAVFSAFLSRAGFTQGEVIEKLRAQARRDQLLETITADFKAPDAFYQATLLYERESRAIDYLRIDPNIIGDIAPPSDEVLSAWFDERLQQFRAPQYRTFSYMPLNADMLVKPDSITDEQLQDYYETHKERFAVPEKRIFEQLRFANREAADAAYAKLQAGLDFETLVHDEGQELDTIKRGPLARSELPSLMAADIFAVPQGKVSGVINDLAGPVIVRISAIEPMQIPPREEIAQTLHHEMALAQARSVLRQTMTEIEEARFEGATLVELASQYGLPLATLTLDANGMAPDGSSDVLLDVPDLRDRLLAQVFLSTPGIDREPLLGQGSYLWYQVDEIIEARDRTLDEARMAAQEAWMSYSVAQHVMEKAQALKAELEGGASFQQIAQDNGLIVERAAGLQRVANVPFGHKLGADVIEAVFATPLSGSEKIINLIQPKDDKDVVILFQVTDAAEPLSSDPQSLSEEQRQMISARIAQDLTDQFLSMAQRDHAIVQNQALLEELLSDNGLLSLR